MSSSYALVNVAYYLKAVMSAGNDKVVQQVGVDLYKVPKVILSVDHVSLLPALRHDASSPVMQVFVALMRGFHQPESKRNLIREGLDVIMSVMVATAAADQPPPAASGIAPPSAIDAPPAAAAAPATAEAASGAAGGGGGVPPPQRGGSLPWVRCVKSVMSDEAGGSAHQVEEGNRGLMQEACGGYADIPYLVRP